MQLSAFLGRSKPKRQPEYSATVDRRLFRDLGQAFPFPEAGNRDAFEENLKYFKRELIRVDYSIAWISDSIGPCDIKGYFEDIISPASLVVNDRNASKLTEILRQVLNKLNPLGCRVIRTWQDGVDIDNTLLEADLEASLSLEPICRGRIGAPMLVKGHISSCRTSLQFRREHGWQKGKEPWPKELLKKDKDEVDALYALFKIKEAQQKQAEARERNEEAQQKESEA